MELSYQYHSCETFIVTAVAAVYHDTSLPVAALYVSAMTPLSTTIHWPSSLSVASVPSASSDDVAWRRRR
jgi:hypothetical protein